MLRKHKSEKSFRKNTKVSMLDMDLTAILRENALRYLPAKALFRSHSVCRDWKLQISTPFFVHSQSVSCRLFSGVFLQSLGNPPFFISLDQMAYGVPDQELGFLPEPVYVVASTNGLLCCVSCGFDGAYYVCNPVNRHWKKLPKPSNDHGNDPAIALVFEPSVLNFIADFKVICIFDSTDIEGAYEFDIYSSDRDSWKVSPEMYFVNSDIYSNNSYRKEKSLGIQFGKALYINGVVYWAMKSGKILSFEMKTNKATVIPMYGPWGHGHNKGSRSLCLGTMDGKLCMSSVYDQSITVSTINSKHTNTAKLTKNHTSRFNCEGVEPLGHDRPRVLITWDGIVVLRVGNKVFSHDMKTQETRALLQDGPTISDQVIVLPYVNSLVALG